MADESKPGTAQDRRKGRREEVFRFRANDQETTRIRRLAARRGEDDSKVLRAGIEALEREHAEEHGGAVRELLALLRARDPAAVLQRVRELLGRGRAASP